MSEERQISCPWCGETIQESQWKAEYYCNEGRDMIRCRFECKCGARTPFGRLCYGKKDALESAYEAATRRIHTDENTSDGYHTFKELYHHRAVLFAALIAQMPEKAWKSKTHSDGSVWDGWFIVGIETPDGMATYHYAIEPYWNMFCCRELERAPEWDGHTPAQAIERIGLLARNQPNRPLTQEQVEAMPWMAAVWIHFSDNYDPLIMSARDATLSLHEEAFMSLPVGAIMFSSPPTPADIEAARAAKGAANEAH